MWIYLIFLASTLQIISADYYTSNSGLEDLLELELVLIEKLERFVRAEEERQLKMLKCLENLKVEFEKGENNAAKYLENPLNKWKSIKRLARDWKRIYEEELNSTNVKEYAESISSIETDIGITKPVVDDVKGAARGIERLQTTYNLKTSDLADGILMGQKLSLDMPAADCCDLGIGLLQSGYYKHALMWFLEARERLKRETKNETSTKVNPIQHEEIESIILDGLVYTALNTGRTKLALIFIRELLEIYPQDADALESLRLAKTHAISDHLVGPRKAEKTPKILELYDKICSGELKQTPEQQRNLSCRFVHNNVPFCYIAPFKMEELNLDPFVAFYHETIYEEEIDYILEQAENQVERSRVGAEGSENFSEDRTSKNAWLDWYEHKFLDALGQRLKDITGLTLRGGEMIQVANYGIGGHYSMHYDFFERKDVDYDEKDNRILTALFYINDVRLGGATAFPYLRLAVPPIRRSAVVWYNLHRSLEPDYRTMHGACPVIHGSKWVCNQWYRSSNQEFIRPCGLAPDGKLSEHFKDITYY